MLFIQVIAVIPTNLKFILIICFRALNPHSPFSPSSSKTWNRKIFTTVFIETLLKHELTCIPFKTYVSHKSISSHNVILHKVVFYSVLFFNSTLSILLRKLREDTRLVNFHILADAWTVNCYLQLCCCCLMSNSELYCYSMRTYGQSCNTHRNWLKLNYLKSVHLELPYILHISWRFPGRNL